MLKQAQVSTRYTTFLAPVVPVAADTPLDEMPYSPSFLLPLSTLPSSVVCDHEFVAACEYGYDDYFDSMFTEAFVFVHETYTSAEVHAFIVENACQEKVFLPSDVTTLSWRVGFVFGWLSALSKYQPTLANIGIQVLCSLLEGGMK